MARPKNTRTTCLVEGCDQPLHVNARGITLPRCHEHQKQFWRETARARDAAMRNPTAAPPKGTRLVVPSAVPASPSAPPTVGTRNVVSAAPPADQPVGQSQPPSDSPSLCTERGQGGEVCDCIYREIVSLLAARNPRIAELVEVMQTARRLRDDLGI